MARDKKFFPATNDTQPPEEMTVVVFKFKGGSESMQKGFEAVNNAIASLGPAHANHQRTIVQRTSPQVALPTEGNGKIIDTETEDPPEAPPPEEEAASPEPSDDGKPKKPLAPKQSFLSDFNLSPAGMPAWKDFAAEKAPQTENNKFLIASLWTQTHGGVDPFTGNHLFTCFRAMDWKTQVDMTQPLRAMKSKKSYYDNPSHGKWRLTGIGIEAANDIVKK